MAFTTPKTWSFGEILTSTDMNTYVRDNTVALRALGIGSNIVQTVKTDSFSTSSSTFTDVTGLAVTITPSSATNKVLILLDVNGVGSASTGDRTTQIILLRDSTDVYIGDASSTRTRALASAARGTSSATSREARHFGAVFLDSPGVASAVTYKVQTRAADGGTALIGESQNDGAEGVSAPCSITAIEVAA